MLDIATENDFQTLTDLARAYEHDLEHKCGFPPPNNDSFSPAYYQSYILQDDRMAHLIRIDGVPAGFTLVNKVGSSTDIDWHVGEFFVIVNFQKSGVGTFAARTLWRDHPGKWEVTIIPANTPALKFWRRAIASFTTLIEDKEVCVPWDQNYPKRISLSFMS